MKGRALSVRIKEAVDTLTSNTSELNHAKGLCVIIYYWLASYGCITLSLKQQYLLDISANYWVPEFYGS
ncbi:hypothetical protein K1T71_007171 [Dendrolimus kikuchii]|uniref:Uncharacterized protein n=1 Tax=Dendrolimus kikuchii TaxID=765133 RepID=A0ACC1D0V6_9NEOP|nr:hypothetical protein K1T71_007171 [Dendrolimus kikuchii]